MPREAFSSSSREAFIDSGREARGEPRSSQTAFAQLIVIAGLDEASLYFNGPQLFNDDLDLFRAGVELVGETGAIGTFGVLDWVVQPPETQDFIMPTGESFSRIGVRSVSSNLPRNPDGTIQQTADRFVSWARTLVLSGNVAPITKVVFALDSSISMGGRLAFRDAPEQAVDILLAEGFDASVFYSNTERWLLWFWGEALNWAQDHPGP